MKKFIILIALCTLLWTNNTHAISINLPSIPKENFNERKIAIVKTENPFSSKEIDQLLQSYKTIKKRNVFHEVFNGFSVEGSIAELKILARNQLVEMVSPVHTYKVETENPVQLIGAEFKENINRTYKQLTGKGVKVGVIDTGIDYKHPDLKANYKGGWDFVDRDKNPMETVGKGTRNTLHGTHVAGIIAADGKIKGVAPQAEIIAYRALGPGGSGTTEQILAAIEQAIKDKVDILNLSLGSEINGPDLPISLALNKAVKKGIIAVAAAGNSGPSEWTVGSPGTASKAISVGASTPYMQIASIKINNKSLFLTSMKQSESWRKSNLMEVVSAGLGKKQNIKNVDGKMVLLERGELTFTEKVMNAYKAGATAVLISNNIDGPLIGSLEKEIPIPVAGITKGEGEIIKQKLKNAPLYVRVETKWEKDLLADFSSRGPVTNSWEIKPDVLAPGVVINSTVPGGYMSLQGTSMAAPHVAGACALILEAHPNWTPEEVKAALMNTAKPMMNREGKRYKVYEQGAGRIQVKEAIRANILIMPGSIRFGKFRFVDHLHEHTAYIKVKNVGETIEQISFSIPKKKDGITWEMPFSFRLEKGETKNVPISMMVDSEVFKENLQDGTLEIRAGKQQIHIPYLYVLEEPNYPRIMGFDLIKDNKENTYKYEVYLPGGAEEFGIALFEKESLQFAQFLDWKKDVRRGMITSKIKEENIPDEGEYIVKVFARKSGKEDIISSYLSIGPWKSK
ncbi:S8 family serine peptidase [Niallia sp. 01092]|uniref:S8 family serine peptidase n=1 Tax=unclassified Niallia TaxID=2837522 RepID=UPI003FD547DB